MKVNPFEIDARFLYEFKMKMEDAYSNELDIIEAVMEPLLTLGFTSVRYWMLCKEDFEVDNNSIFVLSRSLGAIDLSAKHGYRLSPTKCSIFRDTLDKSTLDDLKHVKLQCNSVGDINSVPETKKTNQDLRIDCDHFVHIPVLHRGKVCGQISCSHSNKNSELSLDTKSGLEIIGMMLGDYRALAIDEKLKNAQMAFSAKADFLVEKKNITQVLLEISQVLSKLLDAEYVEAFDLNWFEDVLVKVTQVHNGKNILKGDESYYEESYPAGKQLTGIAFKDNRYRYVYDVNRFSKVYAHLINNHSRDTHMTNHDGAAGCVMYETVGSREHTPLIRVFNKKGDEKIPFDIFEREAFERACEYFSKSLDDINTNTQLDQLQDFNNLIINSFESYDEICEKANEHLNDDWIREIAVFGKERESQHFTLYIKSGPLLKFQKESVVPSPFLNSCISNTSELHWVSLADSKVRKTSASLDIESILSLNRKNYAGALVLCHEKLDFSGGLILFLPNKPVNNKSYLEKLAHIPAYSSVLVKTLMFIEKTIGYGQAHNFIGTLGHEMLGPVIRIQHVIEALQPALEKVYASHPSIENCEYFYEELNNGAFIDRSEPVRSYVDNKLLELNIETKGVRNLVNTASHVAQIHNQTIDLTFEKVNIFKLIKKVENQTLKDLDELQGERGVRVKFSYNEAFYSLDDVYADKWIVSKIFENILRNAVKYSIPPGRGNPITIDLYANPQPDQMLNIIVRNWGSAIKDQDKDKIFNMLYRGGVKDSIRSKRGFGLGLYISRLYALAHGGDIRLMDSDSTFDDPGRPDEGWYTKFEIRLSSKLKPGTNTFSLQKRKFNKTNNNGVVL